MCVWEAAGHSRVELLKNVTQAVTSGRLNPALHRCAHPADYMPHSFMYMYEIRGVRDMCGSSVTASRELCCNSFKPFVLVVSVLLHRTLDRHLGEESRNVVAGKTRNSAQIKTFVAV